MVYLWGLIGRLVLRIPIVLAVISPNNVDTNNNLDALV